MRAYLGPCPLCKTPLWLFYPDKDTCQSNGKRHTAKRCRKKGAKAVHQMAIK